MADGGSTLNSVTRNYSNVLIKEHPQKSIQKGNKSSVEIGDITFFVHFLTVWMIKPETTSFLKQTFSS